MQVNLCFGCMEPTDSYPCPHCGYTPSQKGAEWALQPGSILNGKYMVGRILGQGGFGITYIGWDIALEKKVAVKEYYPSGQVGRTPGTNALSWYTSESAALARQTGLEMFLKEARKMSKVDDVSGIVRVRDLFQENQTAYIVMDYVEGETLKARLQKTGPMAWDQAKGIFQPAIRAMEQVHKAGLIHRDLSPDNLMLTPDAQVKILDLGAAKDLSINSGASSMQVAKSGFSPFEQYSQRGGSGPWTDVYAMAATVYYTLTGVLPPAAIDRVEEDTMDWSLVSTLPGRAREALRAATAVSAKKRTQSMEELEKGLFGTENKTPPKPKPAQKVKPEKERPRRPTARGKRLIAAVAAVIVVVGCGVGLRTKTGKSPIAPTETQELMAMDTEANKETHDEAAVDSGTVEDSNNNTPQTLSIGMIQRPTTIAAGGSHTVALRNDGTVVATGNNIDGQCNVDNWRDIVSVAAGRYHTVGLRKDGTVVAAGNNLKGQCNVHGWRKIVAIAAGDNHTIGLCQDGTVVAVGKNDLHQCDVSNWKYITAIAGGTSHTVGLRSNGTVVSTEYEEDLLGTWKNVAAIAAGNNLTIGLCINGTVRSSNIDETHVLGWRNIVAITTGDHPAGLTSNGTVLESSYFYDDDPKYCSDWTDIVAVSIGDSHAVGLHSDGTVVAEGSTSFGQCDVSTWTNIRTP